jgi:hypothetical protein
VKKTIALTTCAALLAGCSNIGTINGVPVGQNATVSSQGQQTYCQANPAVCIIGVAVGVGVLGYIINEANDGGGSDNSAAQIDDDLGGPNLDI